MDLHCNWTSSVLYSSLLLSHKRYQRYPLMYFLLKSTCGSCFLKWFEEVDGTYGIFILIICHPEATCTPTLGVDKTHEPWHKVLKRMLKHSQVMSLSGIPVQGITLAAAMSTKWQRWGDYKVEELYTCWQIQMMLWGEKYYWDWE